MRQGRSARAATALVLGLVLGTLGFALVSCSAPATAPTAGVSPMPSVRPEPSPTPSPDPELVPDGGAEQNLAFFDFVNKATLKAHPEAKGKDFIDALVAAGFAKKSMQLTADTTTLGLAAQSIQFSVKMGKACLIGQNGDGVGYRSVVLPVTAAGTCLVGDTRPIDG